MTELMADFDFPDTMRLHPPRQPVIDGTEFRATISAMASSVTVVTSGRGDQRIGRTVTSMLSLSANPPTLLVSIDIMSRLADVIAKQGSYSLALLADDQAAVANAFAGRIEPADRFETASWSTWPSGNPMLLGAVTAFDCEVVGSIETGTHVLFAGAVIEAETTTSRVPLIWQRHHYRGITDLD